jgi:ubiquinone/menaquinone biosynthesis C-methylase UbiE
VRLAPFPFVAIALLGCDRGAATPPEPSSVEPSADTSSSDPAEETSVRPGVNDNYTADKVQLFAERFSRDGREVADRKDAVLAAMRITEGMTVADIGSGTGLYTVELAGSVGPTGRVFAVDVTEPFLEHVRGAVEAAGAENVELVLADPRDAKLPAASVDVALMSNVYHHVEYPQTYMRTVLCALAPEGRLFLIDFARFEGMEDEWVLDHVRAGEDVVTAELNQVGFVVQARHELMQRNYVLELQRGPEASCPAG